MHFKTKLLVVGLFVGSALAQTSEDKLRLSVTRVRYATLAEYAQVQGDVHLTINAGKITILSGHGLLVPTAVDSAASVRAIFGGDDLDITYHFVLTNSANVPVSVVVNRSDWLGRAFLKLFCLSTKKTITRYECREAAPPPNNLTRTGNNLEIWINGRYHCLTPDD